MTGFVYAIQSGEAIKIGWAADPVRRLSELNVGSPGTHRLLGFVEATKSQERELHRLLSPWRIRGEWFSISKVVAHFIGILPPVLAGRVQFEDWAKKRTPANKFDEYLLVNALTDSAFAELVKRDRTTVLRWRKGNTRPDGEGLEAISEATGGQVRPNDFFPEQMDAAQ